jgi:hypothetical protein
LFNPLDGSSTIPGYQAGGEELTITDGYLVIVSPTAVLTLDPATGKLDDSNQSDWLQVLEFAPAAGPGGMTDGNLAAVSLNLWTVGCNSGDVGDTSCFPSFSTIANNMSSSYVFDHEGPTCNNVNSPACFNGPNSYLWNPSASNPQYDPSYTINFVAPTGISPEPATFVIGVGGLTLIAVLRRRRIRRGVSGS